MSNIKSVNFYDLCRVCTATTEQKIEIFSSEGKIKNLSAKIIECLPLNVVETDRLPKVLCQQCVQNLDSFLDFRNLCRNSQEMLTSCLNSASSQNGGKIFIKDVMTSSGKSLSVLNNSSQATIGLQQASVPQQPALASSSQSQTHQQPAFTLQGSQIVTQTPNVATIGNLQGQDFLNSIMNAVGIQTDTMKNDKPSIPQYTITLDNTMQNPMTQPAISAVASVKKDESNKNALEEFLKMKPNIKVTPLNKKCLTQQQQELQHTQAQHDQLLQQQQQEHQQQQMVQLQLQQLQQQLQQQWQQQQLQQQIQFLTSQLHPQQITITGASLQSQPESTASQHQTNTSTAAAQSLDSNFNVNSTEIDELSPSKNKKPKFNFVLTPPAIAQSSLASDIPQLTTTVATQPTALTPQIQLQFQPTLGQQSFLQSSQPIANNATAAATLLSNLAPLLQPQTQLNNTLQTQPFATNQVSPNKCFLPITIKDDSTDQQFVAHIDAKNFLLPTTYQLQMKLQPQIATVDGHPIMQLAPTSIPARLQLTPQTLGASTCISSLGANITQSSNALSASNSTPFSQDSQVTCELPQTQTAQLKQPVLQHQQKQNEIRQNRLQTSDGTQIKNVQITAQEIINPAVSCQSAPSSSSTSTNLVNQKQETDKNKSENSPANATTTTAAEYAKVVPRQKFKISHQAGSNTIEITPTTTLTQQIMQQVQQQQMKKQQMQQQRQSEQKSTTVATQHGGITVQRITTKSSTDNTTTLSAKSVNANLTQTDFPSLPILNKNNITISRITPQNQKQAKPMLSGATSNASSDLPATTSLNVLKQQKNTTQRHISQSASTTEPVQSSNQLSLQKTQALSNIPNTTLRISPSKKVFKKMSTPIGDNTDTSTIVTQRRNSLDRAVKVGTTATITENVNENVPKIKQDTNSMNNSSSADTSSSSSVIECNQCSKIFKKKEHLTQHLKLHTGIRPFMCNESGCPKSFSRKEHLLRHLVSHSGKKMFSCDICQKPFSRKDNLNKHRRIHLDGSGNNYVCEICNKTFVVKAYYTQHKLLHKKDTEVEENQDIKAKKAQNNRAKCENQNQSSNQTSTSHQKTTRVCDSFVLPQQAPEQQQNHQQHQEQNDHQQQQLQLQQQQLQLVQQQIQQLQQQQLQSQVQPQIMHLQLPSSMLTSQDMAGNTVTITQSGNDPSANSLKTHHDATVLNLPTSLANFVQLSQAQFVNAATGQIMGPLKIEKL